MSGSFLIGTGKTFEAVVRLDAFAVLPNPLIAPINGEIAVAKLNVGNGAAWSGALSLYYDQTDSFIVWENLYQTDEVVSDRPRVTIIFEYTKP